MGLDAQSKLKTKRFFVRQAEGTLPLGGFMRKLVACAIVALLAIAGSSAFGGCFGKYYCGGDALSGILSTLNGVSTHGLEDSTLSRSSLGSILSPYDRLYQPWEYPDINPNRTRHLGNRADSDGIQKRLVWSQLGQTGQDDTFGGAYLGAWGKGYISAHLTLSDQEHVSKQSFIDSFSTDISTDRDEEHIVSAYVGYGWALGGGNTNFGVGVDLVGGTDDTNDRDFNDAFGGSGFDREDERTDIVFHVGAKFHPTENRSWVVYGNFGDKQKESLVRNISFDPMGVQTSSTTFDRFDLDGTSYGVGFQWNWYKEKMDYQLGFHYSSDDYDLKNTSVAFDNVMGMVTSFNNVTSDDISEEYGVLSGRIAWHEEALHIYCGLDIVDWSTDVMAMGDFGSPLFTQYLESSDIESMTYDFSVAFLYEFSAHVALIVGGSYEYQDDDQDSRFVDIDVMDPADNDTFISSNSWSDGNTRIRAGLELRYDNLIVDFGLDSDEDNGQESVNFDEFFVSARFSF